MSHNTKLFLGFIAGATGAHWLGLGGVALVLGVLAAGVFLTALLESLEGGNE